MQILSNLSSMRNLVLLILSICISSQLYSQKEYTVACIAFYNLENLFDTLDTEGVNDFEFTPAGPNVYNSAVYYDKLEKLSRVLGEIGSQYTPDGPALIGVSEIENITVLEDLVKQPAIASRGYRIIHQDSKDGRGVDVALLYQPKYFKPDTTYYYSLVKSEPGEEVKYSRDILVAIGQLDGETIAVSVNHWPSRSGGEQTTAHLRQKAATYNRHVLDSLAEHHQIHKALVMGDFNDDPTDKSVRKCLRANRSIEDLGENEMYNPYEAYYRKGLGTTAYRNAWSLFDQIVLSQVLATATEGFKYYKAEIFNPPYLTQKTGNFKGYPYRAYSFGKYIGGYSDHFPVFVLLVKPK